MPTIQIKLPANLGLILQVLAAFLGAYLLAILLGMVIWTFRDIRARSADIFTQLLATLLVLLFNLPGLFLYFILRPRETLNETYERSLAEEALLREIKGQSACPKCSEPVEPDYLLCPSCHAELRKRCPGCQRPLELGWSMCPYCGRPASDLRA